MRRDPPPGRDAERDFTEVSASKEEPRRGVLTGLKAAVVARYDAFLTGTGALEAVPCVDWSEEEREALLHCYESATSAWNRIRMEIIGSLTENARRRCPYCLIRPPEAFDHFLPKASFPEFSIFSQNLIYVCHFCNTVKGNRFVLDPRQVLNPYFDNLSDTVPILYAAVKIKNDAPAVFFLIQNPPPELPRGLLEVAERHFQVFDLDRQFRSVASGYIGEVVLQMVARANSTLSQASLRSEIDALIASFEGQACNNWQVAVLDALTECGELLEWINGRIELKLGAPIAPRAAPRDRKFLVMARQLAEQLV